MLPVEISSQTSSKCANPISSSCVIWNGPDISCINLCRNDSISVVVYKLATLLCTVVETYNFDVEALDIECFNLVSAPANLNDFLQVLTDEICALKEGVDPGTPSGDNDFEVDLPECLFNGLVEKYKVSEYLLYLADKICDLITKDTSIDSQITTINSQITNLQTQVGGGGSGGVTATLDVTTGCLSGNVTGVGGTTLGVALAFENLESAMCSYINSVGGIEAIANTIAKEPVTLNGLNQLSGVGLMSDITGWDTTPSSLTDTISNLWITVADMREAVVTLNSNAGLPCIQLPVSNLIITPTDSYYTNISFAPIIIEGAEPAASFFLTVVEYNGTAEVGTPFTATIPNSGAETISYTLSTALMDEAKQYLVKVKAIYDCGDSEIMYYQGYVKFVSRQPVTNMFVDYPTVDATIRTRLNWSCSGSPNAINFSYAQYINGNISGTIYNATALGTAITVEIDSAALSKSNIYRLTATAVYADGESVSTSILTTLKIT